MPLERRTRATLRSAEFGFLGVLVYTRVHTPRRWGAPFNAGVLPFVGFDWRPLRTSCWMVGTTRPFERTLALPCEAGRRAGDAERSPGPTGKPTGVGVAIANRRPGRPTARPGPGTAEAPPERGLRSYRSPVGSDGGVARGGEVDDLRTGVAGPVHVGLARQ